MTPSVIITRISFFRGIIFSENSGQKKQDKSPALLQLVACHKILTALGSAGLSQWESGPELGDAHCHENSQLPDLNLRGVLNIGVKRLHPLHWFFLEKETAAAATETENCTMSQLKRIPGSQGLCS